MKKNLQRRLFCFGMGYCASELVKAGDWDSVVGTHRGDFPLNDDMQKKLAEATHVVLSIPPDAEGDLVYRENYEINAEWIGYLSTTGVYGDAQGGWVDETSPCNPSQERSKWRVIAEQQWLASGLPVEVFRLSGIYGAKAERNQLDSVRDGSSRRIAKENQFFSRIHVDDITQILLASIAQPQAGEIYNCADDFPCPQAEVVEFAADLLGVEPPPLVKFEDAELSPMARSFYSSSRKVNNDKIKSKLGIKLAFPTYKEGLRDIWEKNL
jgi:nucleoside-diphosphate-sugar epimerase